jgi:tRNA-splicing endonuclease subunit Sen2
MPKQRQENLGMVYCINRVITQVKKTLVLVYVDIPKSLDDGAEKEIGVDGILARYKVRRW